MWLKVYLSLISSKCKTLSRLFFSWANFIKDIGPVKFLPFPCYWSTNLSIAGPPCVDSRDWTQAHSSSPLVSIICWSRPWDAYWMHRWLKQISANHIRGVEEAETFGNLQLLEWAWREPHLGMLAEASVSLRLRILRSLPHSISYLPFTVYR